MAQKQAPDWGKISLGISKMLYDSLTSLVAQQQLSLDVLPRLGHLIDLMSELEQKGSQIWQEDWLGSLFEKPRVGRPFVEQIGKQTYSAPFAFDDTQMHSFVLQGNITKIRRYLDQMFNEPSRGVIEFRPITDRLVLSFQKFDDLFFLSPEGYYKGFSEGYNEFTLWILALAGKPSGLGFFIPRSLVAIPVHLFLDNSVAMATGREVQGWPKQWGSDMQIPPLEIDRDPTSDFEIPFFNLKALVTKDTDQDPGLSGLKRQVLMRVYRPLHNLIPLGTYTAQTRRNVVYAVCEALNLTGDISQLNNLVGQLLGDQELHTSGYSFTSIAEYIMQQGVSVAFLKQFRDAQDGQVACYQAIVEAPCYVRELSHFAQYDSAGFHLLIRRGDSHPFIRTFGIEMLPRESVDQDLQTRMEDLRTTPNADKLLEQYRKMQTDLEQLTDDMKAIKILQVFQLEFDLIVGHGTRSYLLSD